jgi:hypothetical protein
MLTLSQAPEIEPVYAATRRDEEEGGHGWWVFLGMMSVVTAAVGYAIGFERGSTTRGSKKKSWLDT